MTKLIGTYTGTQATMHNNMAVMMMGMMMMRPTEPGAVELA